MNEEVDGLDKYSHTKSKDDKQTAMIIDRQMTDAEVDGHTVRHTVKTDMQTDGWRDKQVERQTDGETNEHTDRQMSGQRDTMMKGGQKYGSLNIQTHRVI